MIPEFIHGCISPVFTAFDSEGRIDQTGQRAILDYLVETHAVNAYFVRSGMGQMFTFSYDDVRQMAEIACGHMAGKGAILVGATGIWDRNYNKRPDPKVFTKQAIELSQFAENAGAAGVVHTLPEAIEPTADETPADVVIRYFETIQAAVKIPVLIYQAPGTDTRFCVTPELLATLADMPNIRGIKVSSSDAMYIFDLMYAVRGKDFGYICGNETAFLAALLTGARAVIGQGATVSPKILKAVQDRFEEHDLEGAMAAQSATNLLVKESANTVEFFKRYLAEKGYPVQPYVRGVGDTLYAKVAPSELTDATYTTYKNLLDQELAKF